MDIVRYIGRISNKLFGKIVDKYEKEIEPLKSTLQKANIKILYRTYISIVIFLTILSFLVSILSVPLILWLLGFDRVFIVIGGLTLPIVISFTVFILIWSYPSLKMSRRRRDIDMNIPFALIHMSAMAESGARPYSMFKTVSQFKEYGELSVELSRIIRNIDVFGLDVITAIKDVANKTPSKKLRDVLMEISTSIQTGGDIGAYLKQKSDEELYDYRNVRQKIISTISTFADFYTAAVVAFPLLLVVILSILNTMGGTVFGMAIKDVMIYSVFVGIPVANIIFLIILYNIQEG